jgi:phosphoadenosine phosphosulfate reductase
MREILKEAENKSAEQILTWALEKYSDKSSMASSFGAEDVVLIDMLSKISDSPQIFTLDTGRLPQETYNLMEELSQRYSIKFKVYCPDSNDLEEMLQSYGPNLFYQSVELRKLCCQIRKVKPLNKALSDLDAWITGLRRSQSVTRASAKKVEYDQAHGLIKINPLADWSEKQVWDYIKENKVPYNSLHDRGFPSIGCLPCTRATKPGEDIRAGRWWWENPNEKECGLHAETK